MALLPLAYMAAVFLLSSIPGGGGAASAGVNLDRFLNPIVQNMLHIPLFGGLAASWYLGLSGFASCRKRRTTIAFVCTTLYAMLDELHQATVPGRYASVSDFGLDVIGASIILAAIVFFRRSGYSSPADESHAQ